MNSVQRVHTALRNQQPDRVPVLEFVIDDRVGKAAVPGCRDVFDCMDRLDMDGVGCGPVYEHVQEHGGGRYTDEWGVTYGSGPEMLDHPDRGPIETIEDAAAYTPPDPHAPHRLTKLRDLVERYKGKRAICFHHRAAFMWSAYLCGMDNLLADMLVNREKAEIVMDKVLEANRELVRNAIRAGAEVIFLGDDYAHNLGPMMSPALFKELILPRLATMVATVHEEGALCVKHTDGNIYSLLEMIVGAGPDCINPIEPAAGMELKRVKELVGDRVSIAGNIDCGQLLPYGSVEDVREAVRQAIADAAPGGGVHPLIFEQHPLDL